MLHSHGHRIMVTGMDVNNWSVDIRQGFISYHATHGLCYAGKRDWMEPFSGISPEDR